jgi:transposase
MFIKRKSVKNQDGTERSYLQLVESRRINGTPRQIVLLNLGRSDETQSQETIEKVTEAMLSASKMYDILRLQDDLKAEWTKEFGPSLIFRRLWDEIGISDLITAEVKEFETEFSIPDAVFNMVLNRLSEPCSKWHLDVWQGGTYGIEKFDSHQYYRAMDYLRMFRRVRDLFQQEIDFVLFDTTSLVYYGEGEESEELLAHGFSKAHRGDLKQIVVGVIMSKDGIPLGHEVFPGNQNDVTCFRQIVEKVSEKFKIGRVILVGDRGMISKANVDDLVERGHQYILGYRMRTIPKTDRAEIFSKAQMRRIKGQELRWKEVDYKGQRLIVCYNPERAELDQKKREEILQRIRERIKSGDIRTIVTNGDFKRFLRIAGEKPTIDNEAVKRDETYDGIFVISSNTKMRPLEIIERYKDLWRVEAGFRQLKSEIEAGPIFHWKDRRIRAHIMICFLALMLRTALYKRIKKEDEESSYRLVMSDLRQLRAIGLRLKDQEAIIRTELQPGAALAFRALSMRPPNRILSSTGSETVVVRH